MDINKFALLRFLFCIVLTVNPVKGDLDWKVYKKINHFGQELILFCMVKNCCSKSAGWIQHNEPIFLNVANLKYNDTNKYDGRLGQEGFFLFIRNFTMQDIDIEYSCSYGFQVSEQKVLNSSSVIREILPTTAPFSKGLTECTMPVQVYVVLLIMGLFILMLALFHVPCISRKIRSAYKKSVNISCSANEHDGELQNGESSKLATEENISSSANEHRGELQNGESSKLTTEENISSSANEHREELQNGESSKLTTEENISSSENDSSQLTTITCKKSENISSSENEDDWELQNGESSRLIPGENISSSANEHGKKDGIEFLTVPNDSAKCKKDSEDVEYSTRRLQRGPPSAESYYSCREDPESPSLYLNRDDYI